MTVYLDTSVIVPLFMDEAFSSRSHDFLRSRAPVCLVSDFAAAEFSSALARRVRMGELIVDRARIAFGLFDDWMPRAAQQVETAATDISAAAAFIRRLDLPLRTPDALHIAIARRMGASLVTFDDGMAAAARILGVAVDNA